jgi:hypothetical protein
MITNQFRREFNQAQREALNKGMQCVVYCTPAFHTVLRNKGIVSDFFDDLMKKIYPSITCAVFYVVDDEHHPCYRIVIV